MRPLRIRLVNFGPYKDQTIDFEDFNEAPLFLISGKTGSGKTTIFDAMCFALFGRSSGGDRNPEEMRSDFADESEETVVTFIFEHQGKQYVITRKPKQILAKKRGSGTTEQAASVDLTVTDHDGKEHSWTKRGDVDRKLFDLLHLTPAQFTQIVLLPQGQFRQFLEANSNDKQALLADLFGTDLYNRWASNLNDQLKTMRQAAKDQSTQLATYAKMIKWQEDTEVPADDAPATDVLTMLNTQNEAMQPELTRRQQANESASKTLSHLTTQVKTEENLSSVFDQRDQAKQAFEQLMAQSSEMADLTAQIKQLEWVQKTVPLQTKLVEAQELETTTAKKLAATTPELATARQQLAAATATMKELETQKSVETNRQSEITRLKQVRPLFETVATLAKQQQAQQDKLTQARAEVAKYADKVTANQQLTAHLEGQLQQLADLDAQQLTLKDQQHTLKNLQNVQTELGQQQTVLSQRQQRMSELQQQLATQTVEQGTVTKRYEQLDHDWTVGQIQRLSAKLQDGEPCPVCGSTEHPHIAVAIVTKVTEDELKTADQQRQPINKQVASVSGQLDELIAAQQTARSTFEDRQRNWINDVHQLLDLTDDSTAMTPAETTDSLQKFAQQLMIQQQQLTQQLTIRGEAQEQLTETKSQLQAVMTQNAEAEEVVQQVQTHLTTITTQLADRRHDLPVQFADLTELDTHLQRLDQLSQAYLAAVTDGQQQHDKAQQLVTQLATQVSGLQQSQDEQHEGAIVAQQKFDHELVIHDAQMTNSKFTKQAQELPQLDDKRKQHQAYLDNKNRVHAQMDTLAKQLDGQDRPHVDETIKLRDGQAQKQAATQQAFFSYQQVLQNNEDVATKMKTLLDDSHDAQQQLAEMAELADTATGKSDLHLSLERYILQTYLQKVLEVANVRLAVLTNKRYQFRLETSTGSRATDTGLEINVFDDQAGKIRSVHTLSGGESFIAALSLALALGEVIQNEAGGISIEALFVDEGFGSLDEEALQMAMEALQTIEGKNRMIGIISHVTELQEQIPDQLQVVSLANGQSRIKYQHEL